MNYPSRTKVLALSYLSTWTFLKFYFQHLLEREQQELQQIQEENAMIRTDQGYFIKPETASNNAYRRYTFNENRKRYFGNTHVNPFDSNLSITAKKPKIKSLEKTKFEIHSTGIRCYVNAIYTQRNLFARTSTGIYAPILWNKKTSDPITDPEPLATTEGNKDMQPYYNRNLLFTQPCCITFETNTYPNFWDNMLEENGKKLITDQHYKVLAHTPKKEFVWNKQREARAFFDARPTFYQGLDGVPQPLQNYSGTYYPFVQVPMNVPFPNTIVDMANTTDRYHVNGLLMQVASNTVLGINTHDRSDDTSKVRNNYAHFEIRSSQLAKINDIFRFKEVRFIGVELKFRPFKSIRGNPHLGHFAILNLMNNQWGFDPNTGFNQHPISFTDIETSGEYQTVAPKLFNTLKPKKADLLDLTYVLTHLDNILQKRPMNQPWKIFFPSRQQDTDNQLYENKTWVTPQQLLQNADDDYWSGDMIKTFNRWCRVYMIPFTQAELYKELHWISRFPSSPENPKVINDDEWEQQTLPKSEQSLSAFQLITSRKDDTQAYQYLNDGCELYKGTTMYDSVMNALSKPKRVKTTIYYHDNADKDFDYDARTGGTTLQELNNNLLTGLSKPNQQQNMGETTTHDLRNPEDFVKHSIATFRAQRRTDSIQVNKVTTDTSETYNATIKPKNYQVATQTPFGDFFFVWKFETRRPLVHNPISDMPIAYDVPNL